MGQFFSFRLRFLSSLMACGVAALCFVGSSVSLLAQAPAPAATLALPPAPLLPETLRSGPGHEAGEGVPAWSGDAAAVLTEDGIKRYERGTAPSGTVTVYQFGDATGAYAAYDALRKSAAYVERSGVSLIVADLKLNPEAAKKLLQTVEVGLPKVGGPRGQMPLLPTFLPQKNLDKGSVRYAVGPAGYQATGGVLPAGIVGFDKAAETITAEYMGRGTLTLLLYPTPQIAGDHGRQIEAEMNREGVSAGTVKLRREGPLLAMTTGAWTPEEAKAMVEGIHLGEQVTFDKKMPLEFHAEVQKTYSLLTSIMAFCGVGVLAAVILGLFLGGGRAAVRVLQGKPAASEPEFLRIDLRGKTIPIHAEAAGDEAKRQG